MSGNILMLQSQTMPYHVEVIRGLVNAGFNVHIINRDKNVVSSYQMKPFDGVEIYPRSTFSDWKSIYSLICKLHPSIITCAGTIDGAYLKALGHYRKSDASRGVPVIMFSDTQWRGGRQWINVLLSRFRHQKWFTHALVAGARQYHYGRLLGFKDRQLIMPYLSADTTLFSTIDIESKRASWPKRLLYVGRFAEVKGLDVLMEAWSRIKNHNGWKLTLVGEGPLEIQESTDVEKIGYRTQPEIVEIMKNSGCFILPSRFEPWALVIHEAAAAGLPIICSDCVGASDTFCIHNANGLIFDNGDVSSLVKAIENIIDRPSDDLYKMGLRSRELSHRISPSDVTSAILSVL